MHVDTKSVKARLLHGKCCENRQDLLSARLAYKELQLVADDASMKDAAGEVGECFRHSCSQACLLPAKIKGISS